MGKFVTAVLLFQVALFVHCTTEDDHQEYITDERFQQVTCGPLLELSTNDLDQKLQKDKPHINYMYPCDKCNTERINYLVSDYNKLFYKYDEKTDFFVLNMTLGISSKDVCECDLNVKEEDIAKAIEAYKKQHDFNCSKMNPTKEKAFDLDPAKLKECFQSTEGGESKAKLAVNWGNVYFPVLLQEKWDRESDKVTHHVLQKEMSPYTSLEVTRLDDKGDKHEDQKIAECLKKTNFFYASPYRYIDYTVWCGRDEKEMLFKGEVPHKEACRAGYDPKP